MFPEASCAAGRQIQEHLKHSSEVQAQRQTSCGTEPPPPPHPTPCLHVGMLILEQLLALWFLMKINDGMQKQKDIRPGYCATNQRRGTSQSALSVTLL